MTFENPGDSWKKDPKKQYAGRLGRGRRAKMQVIYVVSASSKPYGGLLWSQDDCPCPETCTGVWKCIQRLHSEGCDVNECDVNETIISNIYMALHTFCVAEKRWLKLREATHFVHGSVTTK